MNEISDELLKEVVDGIIENINELDDSKSDFVMGQRLAYVASLGYIKAAVMDRAEKFGLDGDLDKKFGLI